MQGIKCIKFIFVFSIQLTLYPKNNIMNEMIKLWEVFMGIVDNTLNIELSYSAEDTYSALICAAEQLHS